MSRKRKPKIEKDTRHEHKVDNLSSQPKPEIQEKKYEIILTAMNDEQKQLIKEINKNLITFVTGKPGTGKTFISTILGLIGLLENKYKKLILTRPCVEAFGESLGFLPGNYNEKIGPYMIPIFDAISEYIPQKDLEKLVLDKRIITLPLAYHRGCTFSNSFVIADEFENTIPSQMRLFLTRTGKNSKVVVTGDLAQTDIEGMNGLQDAIKRLKGVEGIGMIEMSAKAIVRNPIIEKIEEEYNK